MPYSDIKLILTDVDGVMTDGGVTFSHHETPDGHEGGESETKTFNIRDGLGIRLWQQVGGNFGIVTGRQSPIVARRATELGIDIVHQGISEKLPVVETLCSELATSFDKIAYVGDDLPDLPVIRRAGLGVAVADAALEVREGADLVLNSPGGRGAIRELVELILKQTGRWEAVVARY